MSVMTDSMGMGGGLSRFDSFHGRTEGGMFHGALRYPSPFFDIGHTYLPTSLQHLLRWCRYYFLVNPLINAVTYKMAEYPITPIIFEEEDMETRAKWEGIEQQLKLRSFRVEAGLDYFCYGISLVSIHFPFNKYLVCQNCKAETLIEKAAYKFRNLKYYLACEKCSQTEEAKVHDHYVRNLKGIRLIRWNPEYIRIEHNDVTGHSDYFFEMPQVLKNDILMGKRNIVETIPNIYIQALRESKTIRFNDGSIFCMKRPTIAQKDMGWGMPLILPVLKDTFYLQILRKGQEAIAQQHIVPLRLLFPQAGSASSDPYSTTDLGMWRKRIEAEIAKWRTDPNYIPILPLPIGNEVIGGEGRALMLHQEMRAWSEQIVAGMHVPIEFVFGGLQYSGSNVSMRMLENQFIGYQQASFDLVKNFVLGRIADFMGWPRPNLRFKRFKMADDLQRSALCFQLNQAQKLSDTTLLDDMDYDLQQEEKYKAVEMAKQMVNQRKLMIANAAVQGEVGVIQTKWQAIAMRVAQEMGVDPSQLQGGQGGGAQGQQMDMGQAAAGMPNPATGQPDELTGGAGGGGTGDGSQQPQQGGEIAAGMPDSTTAYPENGEQMPNEGIPIEMQSPLNASQQQSGYNLLYLARRAATDLGKKDEMSRQADLMKLRGVNPQLYMLVNQLMVNDQGSQEDPLDPLQSPLPVMKPPRRQNTII